MKDNIDMSGFHKSNIKTFLRESEELDYKTDHNASIALALKINNLFYEQKATVCMSALHHCLMAGFEAQGILTKDETDKLSEEIMKTIENTLRGKQ